MHASALNNGADELGLAGLKADVEEHSAGVRILERAAVAVQPRGEDNSAAACGGLVYNMRHVVVKAREYGLLRGGDIGLLEEYVNFIEGKVILDPLEAFTGGLKLREVVELAVLRADYRGDHRARVDYILVNNGRDPAGCAAVNMSIAEGDCARADADERSVSAAAEYGRALAQSEIVRSLFGKTADESGGVDYLSHMLGLDVEHLEHLGAPALLALADIVEQSAESRVARHDELVGHAADYVFFDVEPLIGSRKVLGLVLLDPFIFVYGILDARGHGTGYLQRLEKLRNISSRDLRTVSHEFFYLLLCALIHVAHRLAHGLAVLVDEHETLHLGAEGYTGYLRSAHAR